MSAIISPCGLYRFRLEREVGPGSTACVVMVNPSTADATRDDPTIRKLRGFAERNGIGRLIVVNKFAFRAKDVKALRAAENPVGELNDEHIHAAMLAASRHIVAWGPVTKLPASLRNRWRQVVAIADKVGAQLECIGTAQCGHPRHPVMTGYDVPITPWVRPA